MKTKQIIPLLIASSTLVSTSHAALNVVQNDVSNNTAWTQAGFSAGGTEQYDERSLTINDGSGITLDFVQIILDTTGTFDDSIGLDINADGTLDYYTGQSDAGATPGLGTWNPWVDASPFTLSAIITNTGTTVTAYWNGTAIDLGAVNGVSTAFLTSYTISDWAGAANINPAGEILNNAFTSNNIRLGSLNEDGASGHDISFDLDTVVLKDNTGTVHVFDPDGDGVSAQAVPEPSSSALLLLGASLGLVRRKRRA